jgi:hypothetical protein
MVAEIILLKASITITNKKGVRGSPCLTPRELSKNPEGEPLIKMEKHTNEITVSYPKAPFLLKPTSFKQIKQELSVDVVIGFLNIQFTWHPGSLDSMQLSKHSLAIRTESRICLSLTKAF